MTHAPAVSFERRSASETTLVRSAARETSSETRAFDGPAPSAVFTRSTNARQGSQALEVARDDVARLTAGERFEVEAVRMAHAVASNSGAKPSR